jgi:hypothetical protein
VGKVKSEMIDKGKVGGIFWTKKQKNKKSEMEKIR